jgi:hypothetical protein
MAVSCQLLKDGSPYGDARSAGTYQAIAGIVSQLKVGAELQKQTQGGTWVIRLNGSADCSSCGRTHTYTNKDIVVQ